MLGAVRSSSPSFLVFSSSAWGCSEKMKAESTRVPFYSKNVFSELGVGRVFILSSC